MYNFPMIILMLLIIISNSGFSSTFNSLKGRHLRVIWPPWRGNPKGLWGPLKGGVVLDFLSARLNFTYEMVRVTELAFEPQGKERGLINYLWDQQCDLILQDVSALQYRSHIDLTTPWVFSYCGLLMPINDDSANINAVVKPFQWPVWLGLGVSIICVIAILILILRFLSKSSHLPTITDSNTTVQSSKDDNFRRREGRLSFSLYLYVIGNLLSQGGACPSNRLPFRLVAGVWTLAAFIFVQAYTSTLFTYVMTPVNQPLINSINDVYESNDIQLLALKAYPYMDFVFSRRNATALKLGFQPNSLLNTRCKLKSECINTITPGSRNVYLDGINYLKDTIKADFYKTRKCNLQIAKDSLIPTRVSFALQQNSPYTKSVNYGLLELHQTGLIDFWDSWFRPMPPQCNGKAPIKESTNKLSAISFKNLTGAFLLLVVGLSLSLWVFLVELIYHHFH